MKKLLFIFIMVFTLLISQSVFAAAVTIDKELLQTDVSPTIINGRVMVPMRAISEALGADVQWDATFKTIDISKDSTLIAMTLGSSRATINNVYHSMDTAAISIDGRTMVPVRFVSEALGCDIAWNPVTQTAEITTIKSKSGKVKINHTDGCSYSGTVVNGEFVGNVEVRALNTGDILYSGEVKNFTPNGQGALYGDDYRVEGIFKGFILDGEYTTYYDNFYFATIYSNGKVEDGQYKAYDYDNEHVATITFKDDEATRIKQENGSKATQNISISTSHTPSNMDKGSNYEEYINAQRKAYVDYMQALRSVNGRAEAQGLNGGAVDKMILEIEQEYQAKRAYNDLYYGIK